MVKKYKKNGKVAILISYGYGAGWSTWGNDVFDYKVAEYLDKNEKISKSKAEELTGKQSLGADGLTIEWLKEGTKFRIAEYDGAESLELIDELDYFTA